MSHREMKQSPQQVLESTYGTLAPHTSIRQDGDVGEAAVQGCSGIITASASHCHCTCFNMAVFPLPSAQIPGNASRATCWPIGPLQPPLCTLDRFASELLGPLWGMKCRWISHTVSNAVRYLASGKSLHKAACPSEAGQSSVICFNFWSKKNKYHQVDTLCDIQNPSAACWWPKSALVFLAQSVLCSPKP